MRSKLAKCFILFSILLVVILLYSFQELGIKDFGVREQKIRESNFPNSTLVNICQDYINNCQLYTIKPNQISFLKTHRSPCWKNNKTSAIQCLPAFYIIGFPKCGTTNLYVHLAKHPQVTGDKFEKERGWWDRFMHHEDRETFDSYITRFQAAATNETYLLGDGTPSYIYRYDIIATKCSNKLMKETTVQALRNYAVNPVHLIAQYTPQAKIIIMMRNPVDRLFSMYQHQTHRARLGDFDKKYHTLNGEAEQFHALVWEQLRIFRKCLSKSSVHFCACNNDNFMSEESAWIELCKGLDAHFIADILQLIPRKNIEFIEFNEFMTEKKRVIIDVLNFLELDSSQLDMSTVQLSYRGLYEEEMWPETRRILTDFYRPFNAELALLLNDERYNVWSRNLRV
jgi:N-acetylgalactosamine 4-sulfate 6-O-sulfotransferase